MNPSAGVIRQMAEEADAAAALGLNWTVWLYQGRDLGSRVQQWPAALRYALLRLGFYSRLVRLARQGHKIVLRYSAGDPFLYLASPFLHPYCTVHHALEEAELASLDVRYARLQLMIERVLGRRVVARACKIICLTPEIARHQLDRSKARANRQALIYPNGILYQGGLDAGLDRREQTPELLFVAAQFYRWHGLEELLDSMAENHEAGVLHLVGTLPASARRKAERDPRVRIHGPLEPPELVALAAQCWLGLSSFGLASKGMSEACSLKVREYLRAGLPVYAGHRDSALPSDFEYFRKGPAHWSAAVSYARAMRSVDRSNIARAARPFIDKGLLLERLYRSLEG